MEIKITQLILVVGLLGIAVTLLFVKVPPENKEIFGTCLTAIISFISGGAFGWRIGKGNADS